MQPSNPANLSHLKLCGHLALSITYSPVAPHHLTAHVSCEAIPTVRAQKVDRTCRILSEVCLEEETKWSDMGPRLADLCVQNARLDLSASRGRTRPSYCLSLGSKRSFSIGKSLSGTMKQLSRPYPLQTSTHQ